MFEKTLRCSETPNNSFSTHQMRFQRRCSVTAFNLVAALKIVADSVDAEEDGDNDCRISNAAADEERLPTSAKSESVTTECLAKNESEKRQSSLDSTPSTVVGPHSNSALHSTTSTQMNTTHESPNHPIENAFVEQSNVFSESRFYCNDYESRTSGKRQRDKKQVVSKIAKRTKPDLPTMMKDQGSASS